METLLTIPETAKILHVKPYRAAEMARQNIIPVVRLGRQVRVDPVKLRAFVEGGGKQLAGGWRREAK